MKAQLAKAGKPSGFAMLDSNGRLPQNLLTAGYDKYSAYGLAWQSLHMAAAGACRGNTSSGHNEPDVLSNQNKIWDPAEIVEFYSTISAGSRHSNFIKRHLVIVPGQVGVSSRRR